MNRNGRRIALSMVAIVLGAGYLMKVIPPETDIGLNDSHAISIDGALVSNPLDIGEAPHRFPPSVLSTYPNPNSEPAFKPIAEDAKGNPTGIANSLDSIPPFAFVGNASSEPQSSAPSDASEPVSEFPAQLNPPTSPPPIGEVAINNPAPRNGSPSNPPGGNPPSGSPPQNPGDNPGDTPIVVPPPPLEEGNLPGSPPDINLPSDPQSPGSNGPDIDIPKYPDIVTDPVSPPDLPAGSDRPGHQVPDSGPVIAMIGLSLAVLAVIRRRLDCITG